MENVTIVFGLILAVPLWFLYHRIFTVYYTNLFRGILGEVIGAVFTGILISQVLFLLLGNLFRFLIGALVTILKIAVPIVLVLAVILAIGYFVKKKKG